MNHNITEFIVFILILLGLLWFLSKIFHTDLKKWKENKANWSLNAPLSENEIKSFELLWRVALPVDYRKFISTVGNGMKNAIYGFDPLQLWCQPYDEEDISANFLSAEFNGKVLLNQKLPLPGCIRICNAGCEHYIVMIISGPFSGEIWCDKTVDGIDPYPVLDSKGSVLKFQDWIKIVMRYKSKHLMINGFKTAIKGRTRLCT